MTVNVRDERMYQMPPLLREALGSILRRVLGYGGTYLVMRGVWTDASAALYVSGLTGMLLDVAWSQWDTYRKRQKLVTAMSMPVPSTERQVEAVVRAGEAPPVNTPKNEVPVAAV